MTQVPQPPSLPPDPLDADERELARALRSLPVGAPPPELDARILGAARRAVHLAQPKRRTGRGWWVGFGTAATALLAIGVIVRTHGPAHDGFYTPPPEAAPQLIKTSAQKPQPAGSAEETSPDVMLQDHVAPASIPPPAMDADAPATRTDDAARRESDQGGAVRQAANAVPEAFPPPPRMPIPPMRTPPPPPVILDEPMPMSVQAPAPMSPSLPAASEVMIEPHQDLKAKAEGAARDQEAPQETARSSAAMGALGRSTQERKDASGAAASNAVPAASATDAMQKTQDGYAGPQPENQPLPTLADDARLAPAAWIARIRTRLASGDRTGAATSLRAFVLAHPDAIVPDDLQPLLQ